MTPFYNNIPIVKTSDNADGTKNAVNNYFSNHIALDAGSFDAMKGFFESRGFAKVASETIAFVMFYQASIDGYDPFQVLESVKTLDAVQLDALVTEILNFSRYKTSFLGLGASFSTSEIVKREILP
jgi:hypothetical protein